MINKHILEFSIRKPTILFKYLTYELINAYSRASAFYGTLKACLSNIGFPNTKAGTRTLKGSQ